MATLLVLVVIGLAIFKPTLLFTAVFWIAAGPLAIWIIVRLVKSIGNHSVHINIGDINLFNTSNRTNNHTNNHYDESKHVHYHDD